MLETTIRHLEAEVICAHDGNQAWDMILSKNPTLPSWIG